MSDAADDFLAHVNQLAANAGIELDDEDLRAIFEESQAGGFNASATEAAFDAHFDWDDDEDDFEEPDDYDDDDDDELPEPLMADVELQLRKLEQQRGRGLTEREISAVTETAGLQVRAGQRVDLEDALQDYEKQFATPQARQEFFQRRMQEMQPEPELRDEYDLTTQDGRTAYADARLNGGMEADDFEDAPGD